ncbi:MAG TPA: ATP-binding protein, partial [Mycobacteriales bacterium]|nr:ATP-binding protein [Mycobacteriales bacterium]
MFDLGALGVDADVVGALPCAVVVLSLDGHVVQLNAAAVAMLGWTVDEVTHGDLPHVPDWAVHERADMIRRAAAGETCSAVTQRITKDGALIDLLVELSPVRGSDGANVAVVVSMRDITAELVARRELAERQSLMQELSDSIRHINGDLDLDAVLRRACESAARLVGSQASAFAAVVGDRARVVAQWGVSDAAVGVGWSAHGGLIGQVRATGRPAAVPDIHRTPDAAQAPLAWLAGLHTVVCLPAIEHGRTVGALYVAFADVGHQVSASGLDVLALLAAHVAAAYTNALEHAEVTRARARQQALIDASADGMALLDGAGIVRSWNAAAEALTGVSRDVAVGAPPRLEVGAPGSVVDQRLPSGRWVEIVASPVPGTDETVVDFRDITAPKRLEEARELFLATTTHQLRTPLTVVRGFAGTLLQRWDDLTDAERQDAVSTIVARTESLGRLIDQLVMGARGDAAADLEIGMFDLGGAVREALSGFESLSDGHLLVVDVADDLPPVRGDRSTVDTMVGQLVENAVKYSPDGGLIRVTAEAGPDSVTVSVCDEGVGLADTDTELIFERFYQVPGRSGTGGLGLGLYIVRRLAEAQAGTVSAYGNAGGGTTVEFALP